MHDRAEIEGGCECVPLMPNRCKGGGRPEMEGETPLSCSVLKISCGVCKTIQMLVFTSAQIRLKAEVLSLTAVALNRFSGSGVAYPP